MQSSSFVLGSCTTLVSALSLLLSSAYAASSTSSSSYSLQTTYSGSNFFNGFNFYSDADPTHGFVTYVDQSTAQSKGLISAADGSPVYIGVDYTNKYDGTASYSGVNGVGRPSVRIESKATFNHALIIADIANMPGGVCGSWPALWTLGDGTWPYHGEIDIIEGVNTQTQDLTSLHTAGKCNVPGTTAQSAETGTVQTTNCTYDVNTGTNSAGCGVLDGDTKSFGLPFNSNKGGVYAMEWTSSYIKTWFFQRGSIPSDITAGTPNPSSWGNPYVNFAGDCNFDTNFVNHRIILDNTFCGDWAGAVWGDTCQASTGVSSCSFYVGNNPSAFKNMYWSINSIKVYQTGSTTTTTLSTTTSMTLSTTTRSTTTTSSPTSGAATATSSPFGTTSTTTSSTSPSTTLTSSTTSSFPASTSTTTSKSSSLITTSTTSSLKTTSTTTTPSTTTKITTTTTKSTTTTIKSTTTSTTTTRRRFGARMQDIEHENTATIEAEMSVPTPMIQRRHEHGHQHFHNRRSAKRGDHV